MRSPSSHSLSALPCCAESTGATSRASAIVARALFPRRARLTRIGGVLAALALLGACSSEPTIQTGAHAETIMDGRLARVDNSRSDLTYLDPAGDYARYERVYLAPLDVNNIEIIQPNTSSSVVRRCLYSPICC